MPESPASLRRSFLMQWLLFLLVAGVFGAQMMFELASARDRIEQEARERLANHTLVLEEELSRRLHSIDAVLLSMRVRKETTDHLEPDLRAIVRAIEGVRTLLVLDAAGTVVATSRPEIKGMNFAYREYFQSLAQQPLPDRLHLGSPFTSLLGVYTLNLVRPIYDDRGQFTGIVSATLDTDSLRQMLKSLHATENTRLAVIHGNGTLLCLIPDALNVEPGVSADKPGSFYRRHLDSGQSESLMSGVSGMVATESFISMRTLSPADLSLDSPLIVAAARDREDVLQPWHLLRRDRLVWLACLALIGGLLLWGYQQRRRTFGRALERQVEARRRSEFALQRFIDHLPGIAYMKDANSVTLMASRGFKKLLGMDPDTMIGKASEELFPGEFGVKIRADDVRVLESGRTATIEESFNGRDFESTKFVIDAGDGQRWLGGMTVDITDRKNAERALAAQMKNLQEVNAKLESAQVQLLQSEKLASIGQLAAGVAHEINNPIGFVNSNLGTLEKYLEEIFEIAKICEQAAARAGNPSDFAAIEVAKQSRDFYFIQADIFQLVRESREGLERVRKIVQDLKDFSRPGESELALADLHAGLDSTLNIVWNELKYKCEIRKDYGSLPPVMCQLNQINQVFMNLLVNAGQAIDEQGTITIRTGQEGAEVFVAISDTGTGIPAEHLPRLFDPFFTTKPVGKGTGLGLPLSYSIVRKHGGRIEVQSAPGKGSTFTVWLPIVPPTGENTAAPPSPNFPGHTS